MSGNVSLYNETEGTGILPTPAIGGLGVLDDAAQAVGIAPEPGSELVLIGETAGHLGQSLWLREIAGCEDGPPPPVDLAAERAHGDFVRGLILAGDVQACHDVSDGGLLVALAEMALAGDVGLRLDTEGDHRFWFGEDQGRYLLAVADPDRVIEAARAAGIVATPLGHAEGWHLTLPGGVAISVEELRAAHEAFLPALMGG